MQEFRIYLEMLLGHQCKPEADCPECRSLQRVLEFVQTQIFSTVIYSETPLDTRHTARTELKSAVRALAGPRRSH
jgi:hypothetical protein